MIRIRMPLTDPYAFFETLTGLDRRKIKSAPGTAILLGSARGDRERTASQAGVDDRFVSLPEDEEKQP